MIEQIQGLFQRLDPIWPNSLLRRRDRCHPMLFARYQTNPNYLTICWSFFDGGALLAHRAAVADTEQIADERKLRFSNPYHFLLIQTFHKLRQSQMCNASFFLARS
jgi:hypothetical protein